MGSNSLHETALVKRQSASAFLYVRSALALVVAVICLLQVSFAQNGMSEEAREVLRQGQQRAALAMTRYNDHFPDQPLWREAINFGERARELAPDATPPYRFLGQTYSVTGWYSRAWNAWQRYLELGGEMDAQARSQLLAAATWLGFNSFSGGNYAQALPYLEQALLFNPEDRLTLTRLVQANARLGQLEDANTYAQQLVELDPANEQAQELANLVADYLRFGVEAVEAFNEGQSLYASVGPGAALEAFERAVASNPGYK